MRGIWLVTGNHGYTKCITKHHKAVMVRQLTHKKYKENTKTN